MIHFTKQLLFLTLLIALQVLTINYANAQDCNKRVPDESIRNRFEIDDKRFEYPFTMFNRNAPNWQGVDSAIVKIRRIIFKGYDENRRRVDSTLRDKTAAAYYTLYINIYYEAIKRKPENFGNSTLITTEENKVPRWTKHNAFVRLIGLNALDAVNVLTTTEKTNFTERCMQGFEDIYKNKDCFDSDNYFENMQNRSMDLIMWLQAYDLLKAAGENKVDEGDCSPRMRLRKFMHIFSKKVLGPFAVINHIYKEKKHTGLMAAAALGMGAVVLNDAGIKHKMFRPHYAPEKWGKEAIDGIDDNLFEGKHWWPSEDVPQSSRNELTGYAGGIYHYHQAFSCLIPFFRAISNYAPKNSDYDYLSWSKRADVMRILSWADQLQSASGLLPNIDLSVDSISAICGVTGLDEFHSNNLIDIKNNYGPVFPLYLGADFIAVLAENSTLNASNTPKTILKDAGSAILRQADSYGDEHYFHLLFENKQSSIDVPDDAGTSEDDDFGTFQMAVNNLNLALDPSGSSGTDGFTHRYDDQNIIRFLNDANQPVDLFRLLISAEEPNNKTFELKYQAQSFFSSNNNIGNVTRNVTSYNINGVFYWLLKDKITSNNNDVAKIRWQLNGPGEKDLTETYFYNDRNSNWKKTCDRHNFALFSHSTFLNGDNDTVTPYSKYVTDNVNNNTYSNDGFHTRIEFFQNRKNTLVQTVLMPYRCDGDSILPIITRREDNTDYVITNLSFLYPIDTVVVIPGLSKTAYTPAIVNDSLTHFHLTRMETGVSTVSNPFNLTDTTTVLESDAENIFMSRGTYTLERPGACAPSIIAFKQTEIQNGSQLKYDDTVYISSTNTASIQYQHDGKFRYSGYVSSASSTLVRFFLPDVQQGYPMQAFRGNTALTTTHLSNAPADTFKYVTVLFSAGTTKFTLQLADPCLADCYFPPTDITIDTLFTHNNGLLQTLGHDLDIVAPYGKLVLTGKSKMSICPDFVLVNKDTLVLIDSFCLAPKKIFNDGQVDNQPGFEVLRTTYLNGKGDFTNRNVIVVNDKAGLVLDSGSYTQVGTISTLLIRKGGTLLVKKGATLVIGNICDVDRGELIAEDGAFVCIEDSADIHFFNDIDSASFALGKDTVDRHIAYFSKNAQQPAIAHVNELGGRGKFKKPAITPAVPNDEGKWASNNCIPFCELKFKNGPDGINNKPFGWSNISYPRSTFKLNVDTICLNKQILLWAKKSLNETNYKIDICTYDTATKQCVTAVHTQTGVANDSIRLSDGMYVYTTEYLGTHQVRLIVGNDCGERDTSYQYFYVVPSPTVLFTLSDTAICPGKGVLTANGKMSHSGILKQRHEWTVSELADSLADEETEFDSQSWTFDHAFAIDSLFGFEGFEFKGGKQYVFSLTVVGRCETVTYEDTVVVPLKVNIDIVTAQVYNNPVGPAAIKLLGTAQHATSWSWNPTDYLSSPDSLNPVATPQEPITYFLTGELDGCTATDSVQIKHNAFAFAGNNRNVCVNQNILLGTSYNSALFLGLMMYSNVQDNINDYKDYNQHQQIDFTKYFTHFMLTQNRMHENTYLGLFFSDSVRNNIIARPWFANYYEQFLSTQGNLSSLAYFSAALSSDSSLNYLAESFRFKNSFLNDLFFNYSKYFVNNEFERFNIVWETKYPQDSIWTAINDWDNYFTIAQVIDTTKQYRITLFDKKESSVEYDEITITVDTAILPLYTPTYQVDSTVYFTNYSQPINQHTTYTWNFGDGSTSTVKNPNHTFAAFDSSYIVCLAVNNNCGVYQYCDTVRVDSMGLFISSFNKTGPTKEQEITKAVNTTQAKDVLVTKTTKDIWLDNIPNPFSELTTISYIVGKDYQEAELRITDILGRVVKVYPLKSNQGQLEFDGSLYKRGLYYSILVVDGAIVKSKTMLIER